MENLGRSGNVEEGREYSKGHYIREGVIAACLVAGICGAFIDGYRQWDLPQEVAVAVVVNKYEPTEPHCVTSKSSVVDCESSQASYYRPRQYSLKVTYAGQVGDLYVQKKDYDDIRVGDRIFISYTKLIFDGDSFIHYQRTNIAPPNSVAEKRIVVFERLARHEAEAFYPDLRASYDALAKADGEIEKLNFNRNQKAALLSLYRFAVMQSVANPDQYRLPKISDVVISYQNGSQPVNANPVSSISVRDMSPAEKEEQLKLQALSAKRAAALPALEKKAGAEYTFWIEADEALKRNGGNFSLINWREIEQVSAQKSFCEHGQSLESIKVALSSYSPGCVTELACVEMSEMVDRIAVEMVPGSIEDLPSLDT